MQLNQRDNAQQNPKHRLRIQREPEEPLISGIDAAPRSTLLLVEALKHHGRVAGLGVGLVPPAQSHETAARDVLDGVEVGGEEQRCDDEDEDVVVDEEQAEKVHE